MTEGDKPGERESTAFSLASAKPLTSEERIAALHAQFNLMRKCIATGSSHLYNLNRMDSDDLAYEAVGLLARLLREGKVSGDMRHTIARYVKAHSRAFTAFASEGIVAGGLVGPQHDLIAAFVESLDETECLALLGIAKPTNRPKEDARRFRMVEAFIVATTAGASETDAKAAAYAAHGGGWNVEKDRETERERNEKKSNVFDVRMIEEVTPLLRDAKVLPPARRASHGKKSLPPHT